MVQKRPSSKASSPASNSTATANTASSSATGSGHSNPSAGSSPSASSAAARAQASTAGASRVSPSSGGASRTTPFVDLSKLRKTSLKRYKKHFKLDVKTDNKGELLAAVSAHFASMPIHEADVANEFTAFTRARGEKHRMQQQAALVQNGGGSR